MKVCYKSVKHLKFVAGINKYVRKALARLDFAELSSDAFKSPARGGADRNNSSAVFLGFVDQPCRFLRNFVVLAVHFMLCNVVNLDRTEGSEPHVKGNISYFNTLCSDFIHKLIGKM